MTKQTKQTNTLTSTIIEGVQRLIDTGATVSKIKGYLAFEEVDNKEATSYLKEIGLTGRPTFRKWLTFTCTEGFLGWEEFTTKIAGESDNVKKNLTTYNNERKAYNNIHAKYNKKIKQLVEEDVNAELNLSIAKK